MNSTLRRGAAALVATLMILSVMTGGAFAAISYDDETTNTPSTSDLLEGTTVSDLHNDSKVSTVEVSSDNATDGDSFTMRLIVDDSNSSQNGDTVYETTESWTATNSTQGHYELNITHGEAFDELERDAGQNVSLDATVIWNESASDEEKQTINITASNDANPVALFDDRAETEETGISIPLSDMTVFGTDADAARMDRTVGVNDNSTQITVAADSNNTNISDSVSEMTADSEDGELTSNGYAIVNGQAVPVFDQSADADWLDNDTEAYAVANSDDTVTIHNVNETYDSGTSEIDLVVGANAELGFWDTKTMLQDYGADTLDAYSAASVGNTFDEDL